MCTPPNTLRTNQFLYFWWKFSIKFWQQSTCKLWVWIHQFSNWNFLPFFFWCQSFSDFSDCFFKGTFLKFAWNFLFFEIPILFLLLEKIQPQHNNNSEQQNNSIRIIDKVIKFKIWFGYKSASKMVWTKILKLVAWLVTLFIFSLNWMIG